MKHVYLLTLAVIFLFSCQQELHFPEQPTENIVNKPKSTLTLVADGKSYQLNLYNQFLTLGDSANVRIDANSELVNIHLMAQTGKHTAGVGDYFLVCCTNDVFESFSGGPTKHWEGHHLGGNRQDGSVTITRKDDKGYEGTFTLIAKDGTGRNANQKQYTGKFTVYY